MIILAIRDPKEKEFHIHYEGHETIDSAKQEISYIREKLLRDNKKPYDYFIYEADKPEYGNKLFKLDEIDFNFYEEMSEEEIKRSEEMFNEKLGLAKKLAKEEQEKYGGKKVV